MDKNELAELVIRLADVEGVSGAEEKISALCVDELKKYADNARYVKGNVFADFGRRSDKKPHVLIDAHLDCVGLIVSYMTEDGFIQGSCAGGLDMRIMPGQRVIIHGKENIGGVICTLPPHLKSDKTVMEKDQLYIDAGMNGEKAKSIISLGDYISFDSPCRRLLGDRICGSALDDRSGIAAVIRAIDMLKCDDIDSLPYTFTVLFSSQEELGERGACTGAYEINPDISIAVDVSFAMCGGENPRKCGEIEKGCMIGFSPSLDSGLSKWFADYAKKHELPFQYEVMNGATGTNADRFSVNRCGSRAVTLSVPLRYMHTPAEIVSVKDIELTAELIAAFLREGDIGR